MLVQNGDGIMVRFLAALTVVFVFGCSEYPTTETQETQAICGAACGDDIECITDECGGASGGGLGAGAGGGGCTTTTNPTWMETRGCCCDDRNWPGEQTRWRLTTITQCPNTGPVITISSIWGSCHRVGPTPPP